MLWLFLLVSAWRYAKTRYRTRVGGSRGIRYGHAIRSRAWIICKNRLACYVRRIAKSASCYVVALPMATVTNAFASFAGSR